MRAMIGKRISGMIFLSVPLLALWAFSPSWSTTQARELQARELASLLSVSVENAVGDPTVSDSVASGEPITDLADWNYTASPMSPVGKASFSRKLLSTTQPGNHATPAGPNPRVPWLTRPASVGNQGPQVHAVVFPAAGTMDAYSPLGAAATPSLAAANLQNYATPNTKAAPATFVAPQNLIAPQTLTALQNLAAPQNVQVFVFQPVKSNSLDRATRKLDRAGDAPSR